MQLAVHADSLAYGLSPSHSPSTRRSSKFLVAGIAMASAGVIAVSPVTPPMPNIQDVQERAAQAAVQLTAATNPLVAWQQTIANTFASLETLVAGSTEATTNLVQALSTGYIFQEVANVLIQNTLNPGPLLDQLVNFNSNFGPVINTAITQTIERLTLAAAQFPEAITEGLKFLSQGQFVEAFSEINGWFVLRVLGGIRPLIPLLSIPAQIVAALPGAEKLPALLDVFSEFAFTKALFEPILGGVLQSAELLDAARAAFADGNYIDAVTNLVNIPVLAFNALVNGFTPAGTTSEWQGLLDRGLISYLTVTLPSQIANAISPPVTANAMLSKDTLTQGAPTEYSFGGNTYSLNLGSDGDGSGAGAGAAAGEGSGEGTGSGDGTDEGTGDESGVGAGEDAGDESGLGSGEESGLGSDEYAGVGSGEDAGVGSGEDAGVGSGEGTGDGDGGTDAGSGNDAGSGVGSGNGSGNGTGNGSGSGTGSGSGSGDGTGNGSGAGSGNGSGAGSGNGSGSGSGSGSGGGSGSSS